MSTWTCWSLAAARACFGPSASTPRFRSSSTATATATSTLTPPPTRLPDALGELHKLGVVVRGDDQVRAIRPDAEPARDSDWGTEYLDLILAVRVVPGLHAALEHIARWGTRNSEAIVTQDIASARRFARAVDSGSVFVNCSTRFSDGGEFGYGLEIGVSTQKLHARGPMGLEALTCVKNVTWGTGQIRA